MTKDEHSTMNPGWSKIHVENMGMVDVHIPMARVGTGNGPVVTITALMHGDETPGILVLHRLLKVHLPQVTFTGTLQLIPIANPLAALNNTRQSPVDWLDMNRLGDGNPDGYSSERTLATLKSVVDSSTLVINLHELETNSLLTCVYANGGTPDVQNQIIRDMLTFEAPLIWSIPKEPQRINPFDLLLAENDLRVFSVELPRKDLLTIDILDECARGLLRVLQASGVITGYEMEHSNRIVPPAYNRNAVITPIMGVWQPEIELMSDVEDGERIGTLSVLPKFTEQPVYAPCSGTIMQIRPYEVVYPNAIMAAIGKADDNLNAQIRALRIP